MSDDVAIRVEHISKKYCKSLKRSMYYGVRDIGRNVFGLSSNSEKLRKNEFWALDDISFEVKKGETLGIIGPNGAGKTTLLKLLNGIFWPDKGKITINGRIGALIAVGAGFHPLLTGKENIYINAAILGMTKNEVDERLDAIVEFADIGDFLDVPVKFYSSGMFVRLGFSVAVHCDPKILLVDEVLAVGDVNFQAKCLKKMMEISESNNTTVLFVSHSLENVRKISKKCIMITDSKLVKTGSSIETINFYQNFMSKKRIKSFQNIDLNNINKNIADVEITEVKVENIKGIKSKEFKQNETIIFSIKYKNNKNVKKTHFHISLFDQYEKHICTLRTTFCSDEGLDISENGRIICKVESLPFLGGNYFINVGIMDENFLFKYDWWGYNEHPDLFFSIKSEKIDALLGKYKGILFLPSNWESKKL